MTATLQALPNRPAPGSLCAFLEGYSLHAGLTAEKNNRKKLEQLLRYGLRPPFAQKRLSLTPTGQVRLKLRKPHYTGQTEIVLAPDVFLRRLIATIPPKRMNMVRFHGIFAPNATVRPALKALLPKRPELEKTSVKRYISRKKDDADELKNDNTRPKYRRPWHELLKRVFGLEILVCEKCGGTMNQISHIDDPDVIERILGHLSLPTKVPEVSPARAPPCHEWDGDGEEYYVEDVA